MTVPPELVCPITLDVFRGPVVLVGDGRTYERSAIEACFAIGMPRLSPVTKELMGSTPVVPNHMARDTIHRLM